MRRALLAVIAASLLSAAAPARESFVLVADGKSFTNGAPVDVKTVRARYKAPFFWFSRGTRAYLTRDAQTIARVKKIYEPLFDPARDIDTVNREIDRKLHGLATDLLQRGAAVEVGR